MISPFNWAVMSIHGKDDIDNSDFEEDDESNYSDDDEMDDYGTE